MAARQKVKCVHCDVFFERTKIAFHVRDFHGPGSRNPNAPVAAVQPPQTVVAARQPQPTAEPWAGFRAKDPPPPPNVQENRKLCKLEIQNIVGAFNSLPRQASQECSDNVQNLPVLGALYAYTFTHLKLCAPNERKLLDDLENLKAEWIREGDACLLDLKVMKEGLVRILQQSRIKEHICNTGLINGHKLHDLDIHNILALIVERTTSEEHARAFYAMADEKAQYMVDTLQKLLALQSERVENYRGYLLNAIMKLSRKSGRFPRSLQLRQIQDLTRTNFHGGFGVIHQGKLNGRVVAVKEVTAGRRPLQQLLKDFSHEAVVWCYARHPNCLPFYGVYTIVEGARTRTCLVAPWMTNGHVTGYLQANPTTDRLPLIMDVACGLEYLHSMQPTITHGDLKGVNILITSSGRACLADLGIATVRDSYVQTTTTTFDVRGSYNFMAPELLAAQSGNLDKRRCDVYAFGCVCYEMYTGMLPFEDVRDALAIRRYVLAGSRPNRPTDPIQGLDDDMWDFIGTLWKHDPEHRPTAEAARRQMTYRMRMEGKDVRHSTDSEWDVEFLTDAAVTMEAEDPFALVDTYT